MALTLFTFTGAVQVPPNIPLDPHSYFNGPYTYPSGSTQSISTANYTVATRFLATRSGSSATVTATLDLPTAVSKIDGQVVFWSADKTLTVEAITLLPVKTPGTVSQTTTSSIIRSASPTPTGNTTSTASTPFGLTSTGSTASTSSATSAVATPNAPSSHYSTSKLAGVAVGCFIGGLLIAGIFAFFFLRRSSHQRRNMPYSDKEMSSLHGHEQAVHLVGGKTWEKHIPQSESDHTIRSLANRTLDQIELHVENYYKDAMAMPLNDGAKSSFEDLQDTYLSRPMLQLIQQTDRPTVIIKHCIASLIVSKITAKSGRANSNGSFLPAEFMAILPLSDTDEGRANNEAISRWRVLTSYLRPTPEHDVSYQHQRDKAIFEAAQQVCQAFGPWARSNDNARLHSLVNIMTRASEFGVTLFAQPASFEWQWSETSGRHSKNASLQIAALPGLYKTTDQDCQPLEAPLHLLEPRMATLRGL